MSDQQQVKIVRCACGAIAEMPQRCPECDTAFCIECYPVHGPCPAEDAPLGDPDES